MEFSIRLCVFLISSLWSAASAARRPYIAAALDHARFGELTDPPRLVVEENLKRYRKAAEIAASKGADIIVYPEYGLFYPSNRSVAKNFLEDIPDPKNIVGINPCDQPEFYLSRPILHSLSCIAKNHSIVVVANSGDIKDCSSEPDCREDGVFHYNTNVVFDKNGFLLLRYYKEHLFFEASMDIPKKQQDSTFETDFGNFATFICYDIGFKRMIEVAKSPQVDGVMFPTMWFDSAPQYVSVAYWQGWAIGNDVTLVAPNIQRPGWSSVGSGIFHGRNGSLGYTYSPDGISKLVIAKVPLPGQSEKSEPTIIAYDDHKVWDWERDGEDIPETCSRAILKDTTDDKDFRCFEENTSKYTFVKLEKPSGYVEACNNGMCCSLTYSADHMLEDFYLGVYNGTFNITDGSRRYISFEENCFVARCDALEGKLCSTFPRTADTLFHQLEMKANFTTPYVYPSVVSSKSRLVPMNEWEFNVVNNSTHEGCIRFHSKEGRNLINAGFKARCYDKDPPYVK